MTEIHPSDEALQTIDAEMETELTGVASEGNAGCDLCGLNDREDGKLECRECLDALDDKNPVLREFMKPLTADEQIERLTSALRGVTARLSEHLEQEADELELAVETLCPCALGELKTAQDLLEEFS